jgi:uncharacterized protein
MTDLFPRGIAKGKAFYDRTKERKQLKKNIENSIHTVLIAPRRYGKTSLMTQVLYENKIDYIWIDFMTITDRNDVRLKLLQKISTVAVKMAPTTDKLKSLVTKYFGNLKPELTFRLPGIELKFNTQLSNPQAAMTNTNYHDEIIEALISLDNLATELKRRIVVVCDEFQEVLRIDHNATLQGSLRHAVERAQQITYLFSGSSPQALRCMFNGKENPLYALCDCFYLDKIDSVEYRDFINQAAIEKWGAPLTEEVLNQILSYSDRYPRYVNALCGTIWANGMQPTAALVEELWHAYVLSKKTDITEDLSELTLNQRRLLQRLCGNAIDEIYGKDTLAMLDMPQSSIQKAVAALLEKGFIIEENGVYKVLDPILISYFSMF